MTPVRAMHDRLCDPRAVEGHMDLKADSTVAAFSTFICNSRLILSIKPYDRISAKFSVASSFSKTSQAGTLPTADSDI